MFSYHYSLSLFSSETMPKVISELLSLVVSILFMTHHPRLHLSLRLADHDSLVAQAAVPELPQLPRERLAPSSAPAPHKLRALGPALLPPEKLAGAETLPFRFLVTRECKNTV